jgi:hypothetical protein
MLTGCGGNPVTNPSIPQQENTLISSTPTPSLITKPVKGFIYGYNTVTEEGETISNINILDVPAYSPDSSGNVPLVSQVSSYLQQEYPGEFNNPDVQELYSKLNAILSQYKPLPDYDSQAKLFSVYQDSQNDTPVTVNPDGQFEGNVLTGAEDPTVKLEVSLGEDNYTETELIAFSDTLASSDASGVTLKSCPEKIIAFPDDIVIFKVFSDPSIDLKKAGLKFTLKNNSIGCIAPPVYLCAFGKNKYNAAYGFLYIKKNLVTPVDTVISATTGTGLSLNIFLEVVKSTSSISGHVYTDGMPLVKGYVRSLGPKACCKLNPDGAYTLPKVFRGHGRSVIATWWTTDANGHKVRHREEKVIEFFNSDVTGFNFGIQPTPTPTSTPIATPTFPPFTDEYYDYISSEILEQKIAWEEELGKEQGTQKTADWLNGLVPEKPLPSEIREAIREVEVDEYEPEKVKFRFKSGLEVWINSNDDYLSEDISSTNNRENSLNIVGSKDSTPGSIVASNALTVKNKDVIMLGPASLQDNKYNYKMFEQTKKDFEDKGFRVACLHTGGKVDLIIPITIKNILWEHQAKFRIKEGEEDNVVRPNDFLNIDKFGVIYIYAHGTWISLIACPYYEDDDRLENWISQADPNHFAIEWIPITPIPPPVFYKRVVLKENFFADVYRNYDFSGSIVYVNACESYTFHKGTKSHINYRFAPDAKVFVGFLTNAPIIDSQLWSSSFFTNMLRTDQPPMNVRDSYDDVMKRYNLIGVVYNNLLIDTGNSNENDNTYLPGDVEVIVHKK